MAAKKTKTKKSPSKSSKSKKSKPAAPRRKARVEVAVAAATAAPAAEPEGHDGPDLFRVTLECNNLGRATEFYDALLEQRGVRHPGSRVYYRCGAVTLQIVDVSAERDPSGNGAALYFAVRARELGCLSAEVVHGETSGDIVRRPWGERSFYAEDPWRNVLCFVENGTEYAR